MKTVLQGLVVTPRTPIRCAAMLALAATLLITCTSPTEIPGPITSITILAAPSLLVHQTTLLEVLGRTAHYGVSISPSEVVWTSSDTSVARVSWDGIVTPLRRGSVTIGATFRRPPPLQQLETAAQLTIKARVKTARVFAATGGTSWLDYTSQNASGARMAVGDSVQYIALFADVNGVLLDDAPVPASWSSNAPDVVSVSSSGLAVGLRHVPGSEQNSPCTTCTIITASTDDGADTAKVFVTDVIVGLPTTVRFAHMIPSVGNLTFMPTQGDPVTLSFGQWVERSIKSGTFSVHLDGIPAARVAVPNFSGVISDSDYVTMYAVASPGGWGGVLSAQWSRPSNVPADSGYARFVAGSGRAAVVYLRDLGAAVSGVADLCYFDMGDGTRYYHRAAGNFDVIASTKNPQDSTRITVTAAAGRKFTYVIVGESHSTMQAVAFPDP
jgi:Bacterial Ig-like domain (group 2)